MSSHAHPPVWIALALLAGCAASGSRATEQPPVLPGPPSALAAAVFVLDEVAAADRRGDVQIHGLTADSVFDRRRVRDPEYVRVVLDVTTFAEHGTLARLRFDDLARRLTELSRATPPAATDEGRVAGALLAAPWTSQRWEEEGDELVSFSNSIQIELAPLREAEQLVAAQDGDATWARLQERLERSTTQARVRVDQLEWTTRQSTPWPHVRDRHVRARPRDPNQGFTPGAITALVERLVTANTPEHVTSFAMSSIGSRSVGPAEARWTFEVQVTAREAAREPEQAPFPGLRARAPGG